MEARAVRPLFGVAVVGLTAAAGFAALGGRARAGRALRLLGLRAYLAAVNRGRADRDLMRAVDDACGDGDGFVPYWGCGRRPATRSQPTRDLSREPIA